MPPTVLAAEEDDELIRRIENGDERAFTCLYERYSRRVWSFAHRLLGSREDADDVTVEVFLALHANLQARKYRKEAAFLSYVLQITAYQCNKHRRKNRSWFRPWGDDAQAGETPIEEIPAHDTPEDHALAGEKVELIHKSIRQLGMEYRLVVALRLFEEMPYQEIADILQIPDGTVKSRLNRGLDKLRDILEKYPDLFSHYAKCAKE